MGRNLSEINNPNSDLGESLQYLVDNVKESNTVIIVSGSCVAAPKEKEENEDMEENSNGQNSVPFYALGITNQIQYLTLQYDVFVSRP